MSCILLPVVSFSRSMLGIFALQHWLIYASLNDTGEMFDLENLSSMCRELNRYSFFLTSMPLNMPGGVSSPPQAMAIF